MTFPDACLDAWLALYLFPRSTRSTWFTLRTHLAFGPLGSIFTTGPWTTIVPNIPLYSHLTLCSRKPVLSLQTEQAGSDRWTADGTGHSRISRMQTKFVFYSFTFSPLLPFNPRIPSAPCQTGRYTTKLEVNKKTHDVILLAVPEFSMSWDHC